MPAARNIVLLHFHDVELLDFAGPFKPLLAKNGLSVNPHHRLAERAALALLVVPGGLGTRKEMDNEALVGWISQAAAKAEFVLAVCTDALLLAKAGLLDNMEATTHHGAIDLLRQAVPKGTICEGVPFVDSGQVVTSAGIAAGIDAAFYVVGRLLGQEGVEKTARQMEYPWQAGHS